MQSKYDVYDDTGTTQTPSRAATQERQRPEREGVIFPNRPSSFASMFEQLEREMSAFGDSFFRGIIRDVPGDMPSAAYGGSGSTYMYESHTSTMGPDGRVRTETVITRPGRDGQPETQRILRDSEGHDTSEMLNEPARNTLKQFGLPFFNEMFGDIRGSAPRVEIHDVTEEEDEGLSRGRFENSRPEMRALEANRGEWALQRWFRNWRANRS